MTAILKITAILFSFLVITNAFAQENSAKVFDKSIEKLTQKKNIQNAFDHILQLEPQTRIDHIMLTEIPAPNLLEAQKAAKFAELLKGAGADSVWIDKAGNTMALRKGTKRKRVVAINGHVDTVFPLETDVTVKVKGDTLYAPGIGDDTRGLMILLTVLRVMEAADIETESDILFIGTVGEEGLGDLRGSKYIFNESGLQIDSWISVDGGSIANIVNKALGSTRYRIIFEGPGGHSWGAFGYVNPIHALSAAISNFDKEANLFTQKGPKTSYNIGKIGGGTSINSIPYSAWAEVDMRSESPESLKEIEAILLKATNKALKDQNVQKRKGPELKLKMIPVGRRPSGSIDPNESLIQNAMAAARLFGAEPRLRFGSTDASIPISKGIPAITIGRGGKGGENHSLNEWWVNIDGHVAIQYALLVLVSEAGYTK
jgi:acetylornithine deacetylase/succinyl-diaminopimelate desuccinylase-like protein